MDWDLLNLQNLSGCLRRVVQTIPNLSRRLCYLCGPTPMMNGMTELLKKLGVPENLIRTEAFVYPARTEASVAPPEQREVTPPAEASVVIVDGATPVVTFSVSGRTVPLSPNQTILEAGEATGLNLDFECRSGICGTCKKRMLAGAVTMEVEDALSPADKAGNYILLCQAKATQPITIEA